MEKENLSLYIHIPFCIKKCDYCDFLSGPADAGVHRRYMDALRREIRYYGATMRDRYRVITVYIGGGTPSCMNPELILNLMDEVRADFDLAEEAEVSMECNPGTVTPHGMKVYKRAGINRISFGLQSVLDEELAILGRIHTYEDFLQSYQIARELGYDNINVDIMTGLPYQDIEKAKKTLTKVIRLKPEHISCYSLMIEPGTVFYEKYADDDAARKLGEPTEMLPDEDTEYEIGKLAQRMLAEHGYTRYEVSNYAKADHRCRHNIVYWQRGQYLGLGLGAASLLKERSTDTNVLNEYRFTNSADLDGYIRHWDASFGRVATEPALAESQLLTKQEAMEEFMFLGLRMIEGVSRADFYDNFGKTMEEEYGEVIIRMEAEGLMEVADGMVRLTDRGQDLSNTVLAEFMHDREAE